MKLKDMTDRELIIFNIGEVRVCKNLLSNHLRHHEKQDNRRWQLNIALIIAGIGTVTAVIVTLL